MDITAVPGPAGGRRREVDLHRGALRLTDQALAELRGHIEQLAARFAEPGADGTWTRVVMALADVRPPGRRHPAREPSMSDVTTQHAGLAVRASDAEREHILACCSAALPTAADPGRARRTSRWPTRRRPGPS